MRRGAGKVARPLHFDNRNDWVPRKYATFAAFSRIYGYLCCTLNAIELVLNKWHPVQCPTASSSSSPPCCTLCKLHLDDEINVWRCRLPPLWHFTNPFVCLAFLSLIFFFWGHLSKHLQSYILCIAFQYAFLICVRKLKIPTGNNATKRQRDKVRGSQMPTAIAACAES